jgi:hypothetical protein
MDIRALQAALNARGTNPALQVDGIPGRATMAALDARLSASGIKGVDRWPDARRLVAAEQIVYRDLGIDVGTIDGLVGEQTRYARSVYEARLKGDASAGTWRDRLPADAPSSGADGATEKRMQWPRQRDVESFYGAPGTGFVMLDLPFPMRIAWQPAQSVMRVSVHGKCKDAFARVWRSALARYGHDEIRRLRLDMFGGCANVRKMRGSTRWSMHAFACAWDVDPDRNQLTWSRAQASLDDPAYGPFWDIVYAEGGLSLGRERDHDWMHFQFTRDFS